MELNNKSNQEVTKNNADSSLQTVNKSEFYATGKRKTSVARVWLRKGKGNFTVNKKGLDKYFSRDFYIEQILMPLKLLKVQDAYNVFCTVKGGGTTGQAGSILHGISRALGSISEEFHKILSSHKFLTRDSRIVERKKYGKHKARKSTQFSKR